MATRPTVADIKALRESSGDGLETCKAVLMKQYRQARLYEIRLRAGELYTVEACSAVIVELLDLLKETKEFSE